MLRRNKEGLTAKLNELKTELKESRKETAYWKKFAESNAQIARSLAKDLIKITIIWIRIYELYTTKGTKNWRYWNFSHKHWFEAAKHLFPSTREELRKKMEECNTKLKKPPL